MKRYIVLVLILFFFQQAPAQRLYPGEIEYSSDAVKTDDKVVVRIEMDTRNLRLTKQQMLTLSPLLSSHDGAHTVDYGTIVIAGKKRFKALNRSIAYGKSPLGEDASAIVKYNGRKEVVIPLVTSTPYSEWMREADLTVKESLSGCVNYILQQREIILIDKVLPPLFVPDYKVSYVIPPAEPVKQRSEYHVSRLSYVVGKYDLHRDFRDNAAVLDQVDEIMRELTTNPDLTITKFTVTGYASPEGEYSSNMVLSENRARSFLDYLRSNFGFNVNSIQAEGRGEDWKGLYQAVEASNLKDKDAVLRLINTFPDIGSRKRQLWALSGGATYRVLLDEFYPPLRRNEYEISYVARPFDVEEAKEMIRTKPHYLSLNEMFLVAHSYPKDSEEFKYVFDVAARMYPDDIYAQLNTAAFEIESGSYDSAIRRLSEIDLPESFNNIGVAYMEKGEHVKAEEYLQKAAMAGNEDALYNLKQYSQWLLN